jgi:hypothetical protein
MFAISRILFLSGYAPCQSSQPQASKNGGSAQGTINSSPGLSTPRLAWTMDAEQERQRGLELGRRWAEHAPAHELPTMVSGAAAFATACCASGSELKSQHKRAQYGEPSALAPHRRQVQGVSSKGLLDEPTNAGLPERINSWISCCN